jgi:hypothetical protein
VINPSSSVRTGSSPTKQTGVFVDGTTGKVCGIVYGFSGTAPAGQTFVAYANVSGIVIGQTPPAIPTAAETQLASTDYQMSRGLEDLVAALIAKGSVATTDFSADLLSKINARRALRGQASL